MQFVLGEPELNITKGVIADSGTGILTATAGPVSFSAPGSAGNRFTGTINSNNVGAVPVDADLAVARARARAEVFQILTAEQRAKVKERAAQRGRGDKG